MWQGKKKVNLKVLTCVENKLLHRSKSDAMPLDGHTVIYRGNNTQRKGRTGRMLKIQF